MTDEPSATVNNDPSFRSQEASLHQRLFRSPAEAQMGTALNQPNEGVLDKKGRRPMEKRFQGRVAMSTFICTLVVAYIAFVNAITSNDSDRRNIALGIPYNCGIFLALLSIQLHAASMILSSRRTASCNNLSDHFDSKDFENSLAICGSLQFVGTTFFISAVLESSFLFFDHCLYFGTFIGISIPGLVAFMYANGEFSKAHTNFLVVWKLMKGDDRRPRDLEAN